MNENQIARRADRKESEVIKIDKDVSIPNSGTGKRSKYPLALMEIGDSFSLPKIGNEKVASAAWSIGKSYSRKFCTRTEGDNIRVWRVK